MRPEQNRETKKLQQKYDGDIKLIQFAMKEMEPYARQNPIPSNKEQLHYLYEMNEKLAAGKVLTDRQRKVLELIVKNARIISYGREFQQTKERFI